MGLLALNLVALLAFADAGKREPEEEGPITKVVGLLQELKTKTEADGVAEQQLFDKFACWCEETTSRKSKAIVHAQREMKRIGTLVLELKGLSAVRGNEMKVLGAKLADNEKAQATAQAVREKENKNFHDERAEMEQTIGSLEKGVMALKGAGTKSASLLEKKNAKGVLTQTAQHVKKALDAIPLDSSLGPDQLKVLGAFLADPSEYYDQKAQKAAAYSPASTTIIGILKDMYDTFAMNLEKETTNEADAQQNFEDIMAVKVKEQATLEEELQHKTAEKAEAEQQLADASQELDDVSKQMKSDVAFFGETKAICTSKADEWAERVRLRTEELAGIDKALEILTSDEAKEMFSKAIKPGAETTFLQTGMVKDPVAKKAIAVLKAAAKKSHSLRLATVASKLQEGGHFDAVIEEVDRMIEVLHVEEKEDINKRDWCKEETFKNEQEAARYEYKIGKTEAKIKKLESQLEELEDILATTTEEIETTLQEIQQMEDERVASHEEFEQAKSNDEEAVKLLEKAIESLKSYYKNNALVQEGAAAANLASREDPAPPDAEFAKKGKSLGEAKGIVGIMTMLKEDLEAEISNGVKNEEKSQVAYEDARGKAEFVVETLNAKKTNLKQSISDTNERIDDGHTEHEDFQKLLIEEQSYLREIKPDCDFILENFSDRRFKRNQEMEGLVEAKAMMQGAAPEEGLVQKTVDTSFLQRH